MHPCGNLCGDDFSGTGQRGGIIVGRRIQVSAMRSAEHIQGLFCGLGKHGGIGHSQRMPGVDSAGREDDISTINSNITIHCVHPAGLWVCLPAIEALEAQVTVKIHIQLRPGVPRLSGGVGSLVISKLGNITKK